MTSCPHCGETHGAENHFCPVTGQPIDLGTRLVGQTLLEWFKVIDIFNEGSLGAVAEVVDMRSGRRYVAKQIHPRHSKYRDATDKMFEDAQRAGKLGCKYVNKVVQFGYDNGTAPTIVRELLVGQSLASYIEQNGQLALNQAIKITREMLIAFNALHGAGLFDFYFCSKDIFLVKSKTDEEIIVKINDIGEHHIKKEIQKQNQKEEKDLGHLAPEQRRPNQQWDERTDIYAIGTILYQMVTAESPARVPKQIEIARTGLDSKLAAVIRKAMSFMPENRYQSAIDFLFALDKAAVDIMKVPLEFNVKFNAVESVPPSPHLAPDKPTSIAPAPEKGDSPRTLPDIVSKAPTADSSKAPRAEDKEATDGIDKRPETEGEEVITAVTKGPKPEETKDVAKAPQPLGEEVITSVTKEPKPESEQAATDIAKVREIEGEEVTTAVTKAPKPKEDVGLPEVTRTHGLIDDDPVTSIIKLPESKDFGPDAVAEEPPPLEQPSVIVEMTGMETRFPFLYSKSFKVGVVSVGALILVVLGLVFAWPRSKTQEPSEETSVAPQPADITVEVETEPKSAVISVDGRRVDGNPARLVVLQDNQFHTIRAKADGFEQVERDIQFDKAKVVKFSLKKIVQQPAGDRIGAQENVRSEEAGKSADEGHLGKMEEPGESQATASESDAAATKQTARVPRKKLAVKAVKKPTKKTPKKGTKGKTGDGFSIDNPFD